MNNKVEKMFIVRKYIKATSAKEALEKERNTEADDCWVDEKWQQEHIVRGFGDKNK